ncbi:MAG: hypothetical protein QOJ99_914, partial [Bryobacterales bacterium]|nr:hypothetical protein [Bryobacterales bacterium]
MKTRTPRALFLFLFLYIAVSFTYQVVGTVSFIAGYFDLRAQVTEPVQTEWYQPVVTGFSDLAGKAGLRKGDFIESINGIPFTGRAQMQAARWRAHPGETMRLGVRHADGTRATIAVPLTGFRDHFSLGESVFVIVLHLVVPFFCLLLGYWVALA